MLRLCGDAGADSVADSDDDNNLDDDAVYDDGVLNNINYENKTSTCYLLLGHG